MTSDGDIDLGNENPKVIRIAKYSIILCTWPRLHLRYYFCQILGRAVKSLPSYPTVPQENITLPWWEHIETLFTIK